MSLEAVEAAVAILRTSVEVADGAEDDLARAALQRQEAEEWYEIRRRIVVATLVEVVRLAKEVLGVGK